MQADSTSDHQKQTTIQQMTRLADAIARHVVYIRSTEECNNNVIKNYLEKETHRLVLLIQHLEEGNSMNTTSYV